MLRHPSRSAVLAAVVAAIWALVLVHGTADANRQRSNRQSGDASARQTPSRQSQEARPMARLRATGKSARPGARVRGQNLLRKGAERTERLVESSWDQHPAVRRAMARYLGEQGRKVQDQKFDVRKVFAGTELVGYRIRARTREYDGSRGETTIHTDVEGNVTAEIGGESARGGQDVAARGKRAVEGRLKNLVKRLPGAKAIARQRAKSIETRKRLVAEYRKKNNIETRLKDQAADAHIAEVNRYTHHGDSVVYAISDLHASTGPQNVTEDFTTGSAAMASWLAKLDRAGSDRATVVCGGDCLEFMENISHDASDAELKAMATQIIEGHAEVYRALAKAVVPKYKDADRGVRMIFTAGNHDIQMVNKAMRDHLISEMARVGGLKGKDVQTFKQRVAFTGEMAVLGRHGEMVVLHGHQHDPTNNWRENMNPNRYVVSRGGLVNIVRSLVTRGRLPQLEVNRHLEANMGYTIVQKFWKYVERKVPGADNNGKSSVHAAGKGLLGSPRNILRLGRTLWALLGQNKSHTAATIEATRQDDYETALAWAQRTEAHKAWGLSSPEEVVRRMDIIQAQMPKPVHERNPNGNRVANFARLIFGGARKINRERTHAEPLLLSLLTDVLPNVRDISLGHTHDQAELHARVDGRGDVVYRNTGTWTTKNGQDIFTVAVSRMENGRLADKGLYRYDHGGDRMVKQDNAPAPDFEPPVEWQVTPL